MDLTTRVKNILIAPKREWPVVAGGSSRRLTDRPICHCRISAAAASTAFKMF